MAHGFLAQGGLGAGGSVIPHDSSAHSVLVPDTELLFTAQFHRAGPDLVLTGRDGAHHLIPGYFSSEHHPALVAPNGAHLSPDTVDLLAGSATPGHYAQAQPTAPPDSIGKVEKVVGDVTVVRNGVAVALHVGDAVFKSDVVATGASSSCGISFPDGTALNLVANTRMALNDYAFDANSNSNGALFTLVEGTFAFVAGKVAHQGDMKIATPVATMGIRGTTGVVQQQPDAPAAITATAADHTYSFAVVPDIGTGITGMWDVYLTDANGIIQRDANGNPIVLATVSQSGYVTFLTPQGPGERPLVETRPATNLQYAFEQQMLSDLFRTLNPANLNNNNSGGSSTQPPPFELPNPIPQLFEDSGKPFNINLSGSGPTITVTANEPVGSSGPLTIVIWITANSGPWSAGPNWLGGAPPTSPQEVEILNPVKVTTDGADSAAGLVINPGATLNIVSGTSFTIYDFIHGGGTIQLNGTGSDPALFIHGTVNLVGGGTIKMLGPAGEDNILGVPGTGAVLLNIDYTIEGTGTIGGGDGNLTFENFGTVNANDGLLTINTGNQVYNDGLMEATADPVAATAGTLAIKDSVVNAGTVQADGIGAAVALSGATFDNLFSVVAKNGGTVTFADVKVTNEAVSAADPAGGTINANGGTIAFDGGSLANNNVLEATNGGTLQLENIVVTNSGAGSATIDATSNLDLIGASILGGTIENDGNALVTGGASVLHGDSVINAGTMTVEAGASLTLEGDTTLTNEAGGLIKADGAGATVSIELDTDTNVNSGTIKAVNGGEVDFHVNVDGGSNHGLIEAGAGGTVHFFGHHGGGGGGGGGDKGGNFGTMEAIDGGVLIFDGGIDNFDLVAAFNGGLVYLNNGIKNHAGTVDAAGAGSQIFISGGDNQSENAAQILAEHDGVISLASVMMQNDAGATIEAASGGSISWITGGIDNFGIFSAGNNGTITFGGEIDITNEVGGTFEAALGGSIVFGASDTGSVNNDGGTIVATDGGTITFDSTLNGAENIDGGVIKAGTGGTIVIDGFQHGNALFSVGGTIEANGTGAKVELAGATIIGGTLQTSNSGLIETITNNGAATVSVIDGVTNDGHVYVSDNTTLILRNTITNTDGQIALALSGQSDLQIDGTVKLKGGTVELSTSGDKITAHAAGAELENINSTISAQGQIGAGDGNLTLFNGGIIEANVAGETLIVDTGNSVDNGGLLFAANGGTLKVEDAVTNESSIRSSGSGSDVELSGATLLNSAAVDADENATITLSSVAVTNEDDGTFETSDGGQIFFNGGSVTNDAIIHTLSGNITFENGAAVTNDGIIEAFSGIITFDSSAGGVTNKSSGVIEAALSGTIVFGALTVTNGGGTIEALANNNGINLHAAVDLNGTTINGGTLETDSGGVIDALTGTSTFDGVIIAGGFIKAESGATVDLENTTTVGGTVTFGGGGTFVLDPGVASIVGGSGGGTLDIAVGATLTGSGNIGNAGTPSPTALTLDNNGTIDANVSDATLDIHTGNIVTNAGTLEATNGGTLEIDDVVSNTGTILADGGAINITKAIESTDLIKATGGGAIVVTVVGLDLENTATGTVDADTGGTITLNITGDNIYQGTYEALNGGVLDINITDFDATGGNVGTIKADDGSVSIHGGIFNTTNGLIEALNGGTISIVGEIANSGDAIEATSGGSITLGEDAATLAHSLAPLVNDGSTIEANAGGTITFESSLTGVTNKDAAVIEAGAGGTIVIDAVTVANDGGTIEALGSNAAVNLNGTTIEGGTLTTDSAGVIDALTGTSTFDGVTIGGGFIKVESSATVDLEDTTTLNGTVTFEGGGTFVLDPGSASIVGGASGGTLDIAVGATLTGSGDIGNAGAPDATSLTLNNGGTIDANVSGATLDIDTGNTVTNTGTLEAANCGTLQIDDAVNNAGATIKALHGGTIIFDGGALDDESATDGVAGGVVEATARGATITFDNIAVKLDSAVCGGGGTIKASNGGAIIFNNGTINCAASAPVSGGTIEALTCGTIRFNSSNIYNQGSSIEADGVGAMILLAGAMILGGTLETSASGIIETVADTGNTTLDDVTIASGSTIQVDDHTSLTLQDTVDDNPTITNNGTITLIQGCDPSLIVNGDITLAGSGTVVLSGDTDSIVGAGKGDDTDTLSSANTIEGAGTIGGEGLVFSNLAGGIVDADVSGHTLVLDTGSTVNNAGTLEATNGGILEIDDNVCNIGGTIAAYGCGSVVELEGVTIKGGTFLTDHSTAGDRGVIEVANTDAATVFDGGSGHTVSIGGFVHVVGGASLELLGTINLAAQSHNGTIDLDVIHVTDSPDIGADLVISGTVTLTGAGAVVMAGDAAKITAAAPGAALHNAATIVGAGSIGVGDGDLTLVNESCGVINANNASADNLTIDTGGNTVVNHGILEATGGATLVLNSDVDNSCGTIQAVGCDTTVNIDQITVSHGTLETSGDGLIQIVGGDSTFCHVDFSGGNLTVEGNATLKLFDVTIDGANIDDYTDSGSTVVPGTIEITGDSAINNSTVDGEGGPADKGSPGVITVDCHTTLTLDNTTLEDLNLTNNGALHVAGSTGATLDSVNVTNNNGCIDVDVTNSGAILTLDDDSTITGGKLKIGSDGALDIAAGNDGSGHGATLDGVAVTNESGNIDVDVTDSGAVLTLDDDAAITGGNLTTGTYGALHIATGIDGAGHGATLDGVNVIDNGDINLDSGAILTLDDGTKITGTATGTLTIAAGDTVDVEHGSGGGPNHGAVFDGLTVNDNGGALDIGDVISGAILTLEDGTAINGGGTGTLTINAYNTLDVEKGANDGINGATLDGLHVTDNGALDVGDAPSASGAVLTLDDGTTVTGGGTGQLTINFGNTLAIEQGSNDGDNGATLDGVVVQDNGTIAIGDGTNATTLTLNDGTTITGGGTAALTINAYSTLDVVNGPNGGGGATLDDVHVTDNGALNIDDVASGAILTLQDDATISGAGIGAMTIQANNTVDVEHGDNGGATLDDLNVTLTGALDIGDVLSDSGAVLTLDDGTTVTGNGVGSMTINANNAVDVEHGINGGATLDGVIVTLNGALDVGDVLSNSGAVLTLDDGTTVTGSGGDTAGTMTINANNTVDVENGGGGGGATLDGVNVTDHGALDIGDAVSGATLTLVDGTTVTGDGINGTLTINYGNTLDVESSAGASLSEMFVVGANGGGSIVVGETTTSGSLLSLTDATMQNVDVALDHNSELDINGSVNFENTSVSGGQIVFGSGAVLNVGGLVTLDSGTLALNGGTIEAVDANTDTLQNGDEITGYGTIGGNGLVLNNVGGWIDANAFAGTLTLDTGTNTITNSSGGLLEASNSTLDIKSYVDNTGGSLLADAGGLLKVESGIGGGTATIDHGTLEFGAKSDVDVTFHNSNGYGELILDDAADFSGKIFCFTGTDAGLTNSDEIFLTGVQEGDGGLTANYCSTDNITTVIIDEQGGGSITLKFVGDYDAENFKLQQDANGLEIFDPPAGGSKQAPATAAASNEHTVASGHQNWSDHAASPANEAGFSGDRGSAAAATAQDGTASPANQLALAGDAVTAPPSASSGLAAFGNDPAVPTTGPMAGGVHSGAATMTLSIVTSPNAVVAPDAPVLDKHLMDWTIVDGSDAAHTHGKVTIPPIPMASTNEHVVAPTLGTPPAPATSPMLASASLGGMGNDNFVFHPNLGSDTAQNAGAHTSELAHNNVQISGPALASTAPELHQDFAFDAFHQDAASVAATVDLFHQMASNATLLH
jgi:hypothetical protein